MFCGTCGSPDQDGRFCRSCGAAIEGASTQSTTTVTTQDLSTPRIRPSGWDHARNLAGVVTVFLSLSGTWTINADRYDDDPTGAAPWFVLLSVIIAALSVVPYYASMILVDANGVRLNVPTAGIRLLMQAPLALSAVVTVIRSFGEYEFAQGSGFLVAVIGMGLLVVPRSDEVGRDRDPAGYLTGWRKAIGVTALLGLAAIVLSTVASGVRTGLFDGDGSDTGLVVLLLLLVIVFVFVAFGLAPTRVGSGHASWQPVAVWMALASALVIQLSDVGGSLDYEGFAPRNSFYGLWLLYLAGAMCALPLVGSRDGDVDAVPFWRAVVSKAFVLQALLTGMALAFVIYVIIQVDGRLSFVGGEFWWSLTSSVLTFVGALMAIYSLRIGSPGAVRLAAGVAVMNLVLRIIDVAVVGDSGFLTQGLPVSASIGFASDLVVLYGLYGPRAVRSGPLRVEYRQDESAVAAPAAMGTAPSDQEPPAHADPAPTGWQASELEQQSSVQPTPHPAPTHPAPTYPAPTYPAPAPVAAAPAEEFEDLEVTRIAKPPPPPDRDTQLASSPSTPAAELMRIAGERADLRPAIARNPATYPALLDWLAALGDPRVSTALRER